MRLCRAGVIPPCPNLLPANAPAQRRYCDLCRELRDRALRRKRVRRARRKQRHAEIVADSQALGLVPASPKRGSRIGSDGGPGPRRMRAQIGPSPIAVAGLDWDSYVIRAEPEEVDEHGIARDLNLRDEHYGRHKGRASAMVIEEWARPRDELATAALAGETVEPGERHASPTGTPHRSPTEHASEREWRRSTVIYVCDLFDGLRVPVLREGTYVEPVQREGQGISLIPSMGSRLLEPPTEIEPPGPVRQASSPRRPRIVDPVGAARRLDKRLRARAGEPELRRAA